MKLLITAGPTREAIDPVRYLTNRSSGKMGYALAEAAARKGHEVLLISGPTCLDVPNGVDFLPTETAAEMFDAGTRTLASAGEVRLPMLLLHGEDDPLCAAQGSRTFFEQLTTVGSELKLYAGLRHEIFNEPEREQIFADLLVWMRKREVDA